MFSPFDSVGRRRPLRQPGRAWDAARAACQHQYELLVAVSVCRRIRQPDIQASSSDKLGLHTSLVAAC
jgi:hypothetical protein